MHVFDDPSALFEQDRADDFGEARWQVVGRAGGMAILLVAHVVRYEGRVVRLISARRATGRERKRYEQARAEDTFR